MDPYRADFAQDFEVPAGWSVLPTQTADEPMFFEDGDSVGTELVCHTSGRPQLVGRGNVWPVLTPVSDPRAILKTLGLSQTDLVRALTAARTDGKSTAPSVISNQLDNIGANPALRLLLEAWAAHPDLVPRDQAEVAKRTSSTLRGINQEIQTMRTLYATVQAEIATAGPMARAAANVVQAYLDSLPDDAGECLDQRVNKCLGRPYKTADAARGEEIIDHCDEIARKIVVEMGGNPRPVRVTIAFTPQDAYVGRSGALASEITT